MLAPGGVARTVTREIVSGPCRGETRTVGYIASLENDSFAGWMRGEGEWWIIVYYFTWRRHDWVVGPFATENACALALEEFVSPLPSKP